MIKMFSESSSVESTTIIDNLDNENYLIPQTHNVHRGTCAAATALQLLHSISLTWYNTDEICYIITA